MASLIMVLLSYLGVAAVLTLGVPYYEVDLNRPLTNLFEANGYNWVVYIVYPGAICAIFAR